MAQEVIKLKKPVVFQVVLVALIMLMGILAVSGTFSSTKFVYVSLPEAGPPIQILRPEALNLACTATIATVLLGLLAVIVSLGHPFNTTTGKGKINIVTLGVLIVLIDALALGAIFFTPIYSNNYPEALKVARWAIEAILPLGLLLIIGSRAKSVNTKEVPF